MDLTERRRNDVTAGEQQLGEVWRTHAPALMRFATALAGPHDAHDIATTAFLRSTRDPSWAGIEHLDRYLLRAVRNEALNLWRQRRRRWQRDLAAVRPKSVTDAASDVDLLRAVASLSVKQRSVVFLAYWEDPTEAEIAAMLDLSRSAVHRTLTRSREQLRKALQ
jgi:RNA polymerase sigma factor (sigma-70 family)